MSYNKAAVVKMALANQKKKMPPEGSAAEEKGESNSVEKQEVKAGNGDSKPSAGMSAKAKSSAVKQARSGKDIGKKNVPGKTGFSAVANNATKEYGSKAAGQKVAAAVYWKMKKRGA